MSLPGLGSFVKHYEPAKLSIDGKNICAPHEFFSFDTSRNFNDEALEDYLRENACVELDAVSSIINDFINDVTIQITNGQLVDFDGIGQLKIGDDGSINLVSPCNNCASQTFGLIDIEVSPRVTPTPKIEVRSEPGKVTEKPKHQRHVVGDSSRVAFIVAICFALAVMVLIFTSPKAQFWNSSDTVTKEAIVAEAEQQPVTQQPLVDSTKNAERVGEDVAEVSIIETKPAERPIEISTDKKSALYYQENAVDTRTHYIIVGSFSQKSNATKLSTELEAKGYKPNILEDNNSYRVALYKFSNRDRALRELERLKTQNISKTVWLYSI